MTEQHLDPPYDLSPLPHPPARAKPISRPAPPPLMARLMQSLLDPLVLQRLLMVGGGLIVIGLLVTLASYGIFDNPWVAASTLTTGSLCVIAGGWGLLLKSRHTVAGIALTFLGCVVLPLNLWFFHAQNLIRVDQHLWVGGLGCMAVYAATVICLRRPIFLYAVQLGTILTTLLLLGQVEQWNNLNWVSTALVFAGIGAILLPLAFPTDDNASFPRSRYGMPLRIGGHVQLAVGLVVLSVWQLLNQLTPGDLVEIRTVIAWQSNIYWLSSLWLIGAAAYFGTAIVRRRSTFVVPAAMCLFAVTVEWLGLTQWAAPWKLLVVSGIGGVLVIGSRFANREELFNVLHGVGLTIVGLCHAGLAIRTVMMLSVGEPVMDKILPLLVGATSLGLLAPFVNRQGRAGLIFAAIAEVILAGVVLWLFSNLPIPRKVELFVIASGVVCIAIGTVRQLREPDGEPMPENSVLVWFGSLATGAMLLGWGILARFHATNTGPWDEPLLLVGGMVLMVLGIVTRTKATTATGMVALGSYVIVLIGSLLHKADLAAGLYLGIGGAVIFGGAVLLSVFRERLLRLPERIHERKGVFQFLNWR